MDKDKILKVIGHGIAGIIMAIVASSLIWVLVATIQQIRSAIG